MGMKQMEGKEKEEDEICINEIGKWVKSAEAIIIGGGSGLSAAAGLTYFGERFERYFSDFMKKYGMSDMYSAGFYPFSTQEEKWAYWSRHIYYNRYDIPAGEPYRDLFELVKGKSYFVITTNVDHQFWLANFEDSRIFAVQGDYGLFQCAGACHKGLYPNEAAVREMIIAQRDCKIPSSLIPKCPVCGGDMEVHLRCDNYFVEDAQWNKAYRAYVDFMEEHKNSKLLFLELGVGMNTPSIIKYPFWQMVKQYKNARYVCLNKGEAWAPEDIRDRSICVNGDMGKIFQFLRGNEN